MRLQLRAHARQASLELIGCVLEEPVCRNTEGIQRRGYMEVASGLRDRNRCSPLLENHSGEMAIKINLFSLSCYCSLFVCLFDNKKGPGAAG